LLQAKDNLLGKRKNIFWFYNLLLSSKCSWCDRYFENIERKLLKTEYKIDKSTFMPFVFQSKISFNLNDPCALRVAAESNYFAIIAQEIEH
jgi:hypothetical protein